jgi:UDP-N-acetylmuramoyl-tripeptide--D-alanyl-D-alanine ligase
MKYIFKHIVQLYLKFLTRFVIARHKPLIVAVAGTTNKTFVKEVILDELGRGASVRGNPKSFNTEIGLPLAVLYLPSGYSSVFRWVDVLLTGTCVSVFSRNFPKVLVLEMGVDRKGDMKYLLSLVKPTMAVVTTVMGDFSDNGATLDDIAKELETLVVTVPKNGVVILNAEDDRVKKLGSKTQAKVVLYGETEDCQAKISGIESFSGGQKFSLEYENKKTSFETQKHGKHNINALVVAKIVSKELQLLKENRTAR